jgi:DHA1 family L-arabinose/isopropyl-beta-D-thiogalactopyranoside export protein-like MFS transporter
MQTPASRTTIKEWLPLIALTFSVFIFNTSEFIPIGLLSDIAADFHICLIRDSSVTAAQDGFSVYRLSDTVRSRTGLLRPNSIKNRRSLHPTIFWSIVFPLAVRIASKSKITTALGMIVTGTSIAMIVAPRWDGSSACISAGE